MKLYLQGSKGRRLKGQTQNVDFVETDFTRLRDFITLLYYTTTNILSSNMRFRFRDNAVRASRI
jgi:hypothetical protein